MYSSRFVINAYKCHSRNLKLQIASICTTGLQTFYLLRVQKVTRAKFLQSVMDLDFHDFLLAPNTNSRKGATPTRFTRHLATTTFVNCDAQEQQHRCDGETYGTKATIGNGKVIQHRARLRPSSIKNLGTSRTLRCRALDSNCIEPRASFTYMSSWTFDY